MVEHGCLASVRESEMRLEPLPSSLSLSTRLITLVSRINLPCRSLLTLYFFPFFPPLHPFSIPRLVSFEKFLVYFSTHLFPIVGLIKA